MVYCDNCWVENSEFNEYCQNCGKSLEKAKFEFWKTNLKNDKTKSPIAVVLLNFIFAGAGLVKIKKIIEIMI